MFSVSYNLKNHQNKYKPMCSALSKAKGKTTTNRIGPESCRAIRDASALGILFFSEKEYRFDNGDYTVYKYPTVCKKTGGHGYDVVTPHLLGSDENENGYFKIGNGLHIRLDKHAALVLPPIDPRMKIKNIEYTTALLPPFYAGILVAGVKATGPAIIPEGHPIGQLVFLTDNDFDIIEEAFESTMSFYVDEYEIVGDPLVTSAKDFHNPIIEDHGL